jgi:SAM-dependent methyltransferase
VRTRTPFVYSSYFAIRDAFHSRVFTSIYRNDGWRSTSGAGSTLAETENVRQDIATLITERRPKSILDVPCGNHLWMNRIDLKGCRYIGADIVKDLVLSNCRQYSDTNKEFIVLDITRSPLPTVDLIICRDCLVHLSERLIAKALTNIKASQSTYLLTTTFSDRKGNEDIKTGGWRPLNFQAPPFNFPAPILLMREGCSEAGGAYKDKSLGLWRVDDIPEPSR